MIQVETDRSRHLVSMGVRDLGRRYLSIRVGGLILGIGHTSAHFHMVGMKPSRRLCYRWNIWEASECTRDL